MHDIDHIRRHPDDFDMALACRNLPAAAGMILAADARWRAAVAEVENLRFRKKQISDEVGNAMRGGEVEKAAGLRAESTALDARIRDLDQKAKEILAERDTLMANLPNEVATDVPVGVDPSGNVVIVYGGPEREFPFAFSPMEHDVVAKALGGFAPELAANISGSRFVYLTGPLARLERALGQWMLNLHVDAHGYREVSPPLLVRGDTLWGTGHLPKFEEDLFATPDHYLIPTAEVPLTAMARDTIYPAGSALPIRLAALTPCFRAEAGAAGRDTRGIMRQHQFQKVELVSVTTPDQSGDEHERMTTCAERVLTELGLEWRRVLLCSGDMGFAAAKTYDLEVWMPGQQEWREISSCSNCTDFQARRLRAFFRRDARAKPELLHTLNGSGVAVGRALAAVLETHQQPDGSVTIPEVLRPFMGGLAEIRPTAQ